MSKASQELLSSAKRREVILGASLFAKVSPHEDSKASEKTVLKSFKTVKKGFFCTKNILTVPVCNLWVAAGATLLCIYIKRRFLSGKKKNQE